GAVPARSRPGYWPGPDGAHRLDDRTHHPPGLRAGFEPREHPEYQEPAARIAGGSLSPGTQEVADLAVGLHRTGVEQGSLPQGPEKHGGPLGSSAQGPDHDAR